MKARKRFLIALFVVIVFCIASEMEHDDQQAQQAYYCEMTKEGHWPQFKDMECN